jgi:hypothetical protein
MTKLLDSSCLHQDVLHGGDAAGGQTAIFASGLAGRQSNDGES